MPERPAFWFLYHRWAQCCVMCTCMYSITQNWHAALYLPLHWSLSMFFSCTPYLSATYNVLQFPSPHHSPHHTSSSKAIKLVRTAELKPFVVYCRAPNINYMKKHWVPKGQIKVHIVQYMTLHAHGCNHESCRAAQHINCCTLHFFRVLTPCLPPLSPSQFLTSPRDPVHVQCLTSIHKVLGSNPAGSWFFFRTFSTTQFDIDEYL